ncbi:hypothetical protein [Amycolatopsis australiensis]|uniref:Uncharacterized protein n=1 Tax=Amycolatopsis australiensis TaxID=546364 RepID=A0A1K1LTD6_9PSEU|nr:hypothetical protein [Amycolatopsis australiensis]SFW12902.1 hypothetical protein SAMN04489730_0121 [Amycolatopsis australiensis]
MTTDKAAKRAARELAGGTRDRRTSSSYTAARRADTRSARRHIEALDEEPPATVDAPAAVMMARHLRAAQLHLSAVRSLAIGQNLILSSTASDAPPGPFPAMQAAVDDSIVTTLHLQMWADRTAHASGAIDEPIDRGLNSDPATSVAWQQLYPGPRNDVSITWCAAGGKMPQLGETLSGTVDDPPWDRTRYSLPGAVPTWTLSAYAEGRNVHRARDVVPATPAAPVWAAHEGLYRYASDWMNRRGDSPADLAAALDGLKEVAGMLPDVAEQIVDEVTARLERGRLTGVDRERFTAAAATLTGLLAKPTGDGGRVNQLGRALWQMRRALTGAAVTTRSDADAQFSPSLRRECEGKTAVELRKLLGEEMFLQRQRSRVRPGVYDRAEQLEAMLTWMHATGANTYSATRHAATV